MVTEEDKEAAASVKSDIDDALENQAIDALYLIKRAKREINAKETKLIKVKGAITKGDLPKGFKIVATSGHLSYDEDQEVFGNGETVIRYDPANMGIRQKARQDLHKLRADYPAEKVEHTVTLEDKLRKIQNKREKEE